MGRDVWILLFLLALVGIGAAMSLQTLSEIASPEWQWQIERVKAAALGLVLVGLFAAPWALVVAYSRIRRPTRQPQSPRPYLSGSGIPEWGVARVQSLTHNRETAERLLWQCWEAHSNRGWPWVIDKVVHDLERDRR